MNVINNDEMTKEEPRIIRTWSVNPDSPTIIMSIPHKLAKQFDIKRHTNLLAIATDEGILLKKLEVGK